MNSRLKQGFGFLAFLALLLCAGIYIGTNKINRDAAGLAFQLNAETGPSSRLNQAVESLADKIALFTRTHDSNDFEAGNKEFKEASSLLSSIENEASSKSSSVAFDETLRSTKVSLGKIRDLYKDVEAQFKMTDRSTKGIASQTSLLLTLCTQLVNNDGVAISGPMAPGYRATLIKALNQIGEIQNATLFAHANVDPVQLDRANTQLHEMSLALSKLANETAASDLHDFIAEVAQSTRDLGDELANLQKGLGDRRIAVEQLIASIDAVRARLSPIMEQGMRTAIATADSTSERTYRMLWWVIFGAIVIVSVSFASWAFTSVRITQALQKTASVLSHEAEQLSAAANHVSSSSQALADGSNTQAASIEETGLSLEQMSAMAKRNTESVQQAKELSNETRIAADTGTSDMLEMKQAMGAIKVSSDDIAKIIKTIDEIAFQTNILALNAAVEAARAGEAGAGFAVVADEVRNLAQRSAQSAKETAEKIEEAISKSEHGVRISEKVASSLMTIADKTRRVDAIIVEIALASSQQHQGIQQVNTSIGEMSSVTQSNAGNAEETAREAEQLKSEAVSLRSAVAELGQLAGINHSTFECDKKRDKVAVVEKRENSGGTTQRPVKREAIPSGTLF